MQVFRKGKKLKEPVIRFGADKLPAFIADAQGDKLWRPAGDYIIKEIK